MGELNFGKWRKSAPTDATRHPIYDVVCFDVPAIVLRSTPVASTQWNSPQDELVVLLPLLGWWRRTGRQYRILLYLLVGRSSPLSLLTSRWPPAPTDGWMDGWKRWIPRCSEVCLFKWAFWNNMLHAKAWRLPNKSSLKTMGWLTLSMDVFWREMKALVDQDELFQRISYQEYIQECVLGKTLW